MIPRTKKSSERGSKPRSSRSRMLLRMDLSNPPFKKGVRVNVRPLKWPLKSGLFEVTSWQHSKTEFDQRDMPTDSKEDRHASLFNPFNNSKD